MHDQMSPSPINSGGFINETALQKVERMGSPSTFRRRYRRGYTVADPEIATNPKPV